MNFKGHKHSVQCRHVSESPEGLLKHRWLNLTPRVFNSEGLRWGPGICNTLQFSDVAAGPWHRC